MKSERTDMILAATALVVLVCFLATPAGSGQSQGAAPATGSAKAQLPASSLIQPEEFAAALKAPAAPKPLIIHVGFRVLYVQAHIPGSEYIGPGSSPEGLYQLRKRVESLPRNRSIVIYCGCCPWQECPNLNPAYRVLHNLGFQDVKILYIAQNFGRNWVERGFPVEKGK